MNSLFIAYLAISWAMFGLIWVIQLVHYPGFRYIDPQQFLQFHQFHTSQITLIVMPLMLAELGLSILFCVYPLNMMFSVINLFLVLALWLSTFAVQIPQHQSLSKGKDIQVINRLVKSNWFRTFLWTFKALLTFYIWIKM